MTSCVPFLVLASNVAEIKRIWRSVKGHEHKDIIKSRKKIKVYEKDRIRREGREGGR